jgi:protein-L-isoaspartate O-methyltransferase
MKAKRMLQSSVSVDQILASINPVDFLPDGDRGNHLDGNSAIRTFSNADGLVLSAISDRQFLRWMIEALMPLQGRRVFEIGSGTGYFATLLGYLCGPAGAVLGCEIISSLHEKSVKNHILVELGNVSLKFGDFVEILSGLGTFDVIIATSCLSQIPHCLVSACSTEGGLLAFPIEVPGGGDCFTVFERHCNRLSVKTARLSISVPSTGKYCTRAFWAQPLKVLLPSFEKLSKIQISIEDMVEDSIRDTLGFRSYLLFEEPLFDAVNFGTGHLSMAGDMGFGLFDVSAESACFRRGNVMTSIGKRGLELAAIFSEHYRNWKASGCATLADIRYAIDVTRNRDIELRPSLKSLVG